MNPKKRKPRPANCPTMVAMMLAPQCETALLGAIHALRQGQATTESFNVLADTRDLLYLASTEKKDEGVLAVCDLAREALEGIKDRYMVKKKMGATGDELAALSVLADVSDDFWKRQSGALFADAHRALEKARNIMRANAR